VRQFCLICLWLCLGGLMAEIASGETFELSDGQMLSGEVVSCNESGMLVRQPDGSYSDRIPWTKFSQVDLKKLEENSKIAPFVEAFIEVSQEEKLKKTGVEIKPVPRLERPQARSFLGALLSSSLGMAILLLLYVANIYASYEVALFRSKPAALVCGFAAVPLLGLLAPVVFLLMPTAARTGGEDAVEDEVPAKFAPAPAATRAAAPAPAPVQRISEHAPVGLRVAHVETGPAPSASAPMQTQVFQRGAFTFNRRFFETRFPSFFGIVRRDVEKNLALVIVSARGEYVGQRITRIAANDLHLQVQKGAASEEVMIPYTEIREVRLKHQEA
jgi:hypothetical protein